LCDFNDFQDFKRLSGFIIWISMDLHHEILKDFKEFQMILLIYKISKDFINFKDSLK